MVSHCRYPLIMYTDAGIRITNKLWEETRNELRFAEVDTILEKMKLLAAEPVAPHMRPSAPHIQIARRPGH